MKVFLTLLLSTNIFLLNAQLETDSDQAPYNLVQYFLLGYGVDVSNITYTGSVDAIGTFNGANTNLGIDEGIVLTTGTVNNDNGPHGPNNLSNSGIDNGESGYDPLTNWFGVTTYNASVLEFDFISSSDTIKLEYIFGSEEYSEYIDSQFEDVFAFYISGPGISGTKNMALVPGTSQAVNINTINNGPSNSGPCVSCNYFVYNGNGSNSPYNSSPEYIQYDGFTTPLTAYSLVEPGELYHLTIVIADGGDGIYDSGIFLKTNSLTSDVPKFKKTKQIKVYPNPNQGSFVLSNLEEEEIRDIQVIGTGGRTLAFDLEHLNDSELKINVKQVSSGVYWIKMITEIGDFYSSKFVIE